MRGRREQEPLFAEDSRAAEVCRTLGKLKAEKANTEDICQQIADHIVGRGDFTSDRRTDERRDYYIYDTTGMNQSQRLTATLYSIMIAGEFFTVGVGEPDLDDEAEEWLADTSRRMLNEIMTPSANFGPSFHETLAEMVDFGTGGILTEDRPAKGIRFTSVPLGQTYIGEDGYGVVDTVYRSFRRSNRQVWDRWGSKIKDPDLRAQFLKDATEKPEQLREIVHGIDPNIKGLRDKLGSSKPFVGSYVDVKTKTDLETRMYDELPIPVGRWERIPGQVYGNCPGRRALPTCLMLNEIERTTMEAAQKAVDPPLLIPNDGTIVSVNSEPGGTIPYMPDVSSQRGSGVEFLESRGRFDVSDAAMERRKNDVREAYHAAIDAVPNGPYHTATQVVELSRQAVKYMGPMLERIQLEILEPVIKRVYGIMLRSGRLNPAPASLEGRELKIRYVSPAMRAQMAEEADAVRGYRLSAIELAGVDPEAMDALDSIESLYAEAEAKGLTPGRGGVRSRGVVEQMRRARNEASAEQEESNEMLEASQIVKNVSPAMKLLQGGQAAA